MDLFSSFYGGISSDLIRGITNLHQLFPVAVLQQELIRESVSGRQAYNIYLGKHNVGQYVKISQSPIPLPKPNIINHFGLQTLAELSLGVKSWGLVWGIYTFTTEALQLIHQSLANVVKMLYSRPFLQNVSL